MNETSDDLRVGVLGTSRIAPAALVAPAWQTPGVRIAGIASRDAARARSFATAHAIPRAYDGFEALLADRSIDAVYIALPPALHTAWVSRSLAAGKHVLCEKPIATSGDEAQSLIQNAASADRVLLEGMHVRYLTRLRRQRELVAGGTLGALRHVYACFRLPRVKMTAGDFRLRPELGGGAALDTGCYSVSCARYVAGEEPDVQSVTWRAAAPGVDRWMRASLRFPSGATGTVECGFRGWYLPQINVHVTCERGSIKWNRAGLRCEVDGRRVDEATVPDWTYQRQLGAFLNKVRRRPSEALPPDDAVATLRVLDSMYALAGLPPRGTAAAVPGKG